MSDSELETRRGSIAHSWSAGANSEGNESIHTFEEEPYIVDGVDFYIDASAGISVDVRLVDGDGNVIAPSVGRIAGGGSEMAVEAEKPIARRTELLADWSNGESSARDLMVVVHGRWVER